MRSACARSSRRACTGSPARPCGPEPPLATGCTPSEGARVWTCRLRPGLAFADGAAVDAGDVLASFRALADGGGPLRASAARGAFAAWDGLFGGPLPVALIRAPTAPRDGAYLTRSRCIRIAWSTSGPITRRASR